MSSKVLAFLCALACGAHDAFRVQLYWTQYLAAIMEGAPRVKVFA